MNQIKKIIFLGLGWFFILMGILGLFLPILQGILFLIIGLAFLSLVSKKVDGWLKKIGERYPRFYEKIEKFKKYFS